MKDEGDHGFSLDKTFVHLDVTGKATALEAGPDFFEHFKRSEASRNGRLMGLLDVSSGASHWEMHPDGDEFLFLLSGAMDVELEDGDETRHVGLSAMTGCVVPCGLWHRTVVRRPGRMVFITPGKDTRHRS